MASSKWQYLTSVEVRGAQRPVVAALGVLGCAGRHLLYCTPHDRQHAHAMPCHAATAAPPLPPQQARLQRLTALEAQLAAALAAKEQLEQDMKRAFMRGVCALNIEARVCC